jgi:2-methylisocitrate lyase-like PEP mutase family enzyme
LLDHAGALAAAVDVPLNIDAERCFADDPTGVAETVDLIGRTGAAGCSIEDFDPRSGTIDRLEIAVERVTAAAEAAGKHGMVLTARAENHLYGVGNLDDTITRLSEIPREV